MVYRLLEGVPASAGDMAAVAHIGTLRMTAVLTLSNITVMAEDTLFIGFIVIKRSNHRRPDRSGVTGVTQVSGKRMVCRFEGARAHAVVTTDAGAGLPGHGGVVESADQPIGGGVSAVAR